MTLFITTLTYFYDCQFSLTKTAFEYASRENFHLQSSQASIGVPNEQQLQLVSPSPKPPPQAKHQLDDNELNVYETIDKRVRSNQRREAERQRASTISTGTMYESIDRKTKPVIAARSNTVSADSQPNHNPYAISEEKDTNLDFSDPYKIGNTMERQAKPVVTDIYADSVVNATNQESLNRESLYRESLNRESVNRDSLNLEMFMPVIEVENWQAPQDDLPNQQSHGRGSSPSTDDKTIPVHSTTDKRKKTSSRNQPEDMVTLID